MSSNLNSGQAAFLSIIVAVAVIVFAVIILMVVAVILCQMKDSKFIRQQQSLLQNGPQNQPPQIPQQPAPHPQQIPRQQVPQQQTPQQQAAPGAFCIKCGAKIPGGSAFCPVCGQPQK